MTIARTLRNLLEYIVMIIIVGVSSDASGQTTCAGRRCHIKLDEGETQDVRYPASVQSSIGSIDEVKWTITATDDSLKILIVFKEISWPETELNFDELNPKQISIPYKDEIFPKFPEYNAKVFRSGVFLSRTHSLAMDMDIPLSSELPSIPSFWMQFTALSVQELYRCRLSSSTCETVSSLPWQRTSDGFEFNGNGNDRGVLTVTLPDGTKLHGRAFLSLGYLFEYPGTNRISARDEEGRITIECPGNRNFGISSGGTTNLKVNCTNIPSSVTFTATGHLRLVIEDIELHDAYEAPSITEAEPSSGASFVPVVAGIFVFVGAVVIIVLIVAVLRRKRGQNHLKRQPTKTAEKGVDNTGFSRGEAGVVREGDDSTYYYPSFPLSHPPKTSETIYQEIAKKDPGRRDSARATEKDPTTLDDASKHAYQVLEMPRSDLAFDSNLMYKHSIDKMVKSNSPVCDKDKGGYASPLSKMDKVSSIKKPQADTPPLGDSGNSRIGVAPTKGEYDYLEVVASPALISAKQAADHVTVTNPSLDLSSSSEAMLAHQDLYQRLQRPDTPYKSSEHGSPSLPKKADASESYGKLDLMTSVVRDEDDPKYFVLEAKTDC